MNKFFDGKCFLWPFNTHLTLVNLFSRSFFEQINACVNVIQSTSHEEISIHCTR